MNKRLNIKLLKVDSLELWGQNPKECSDEDLDQLMSFIDCYGLLQPLIVDGRNEKTVLGGNQRLKADGTRSLLLFSYN